MSIHTCRGNVTCCRWWKSFEGDDYALLGTDAGCLVVINLLTSNEVLGDMHDSLDLPALASF